MRPCEVTDVVALVSIIIAVCKVPFLALSMLKYRRFAAAFYHTGKAGC